MTPTLVISPTLVEPSNKAKALIFAEFATVSEQVVNVVANASASELPPPSCISNLPTSIELPVVNPEAA